MWITNNLQIWKGEEKKLILYCQYDNNNKLNKMKKNAQVTGTSVEQTANGLLGTAAKKLYYLIVETDNGKLIINVGQKTHDSVLELCKEPVTKEQIDKPEGGKK